MASLSRSRRRRRGIIATLATIGLGVAVWLVGFSSALALQTVEIKGAALASREAILAAAEIPIGRPMILIRSTDVSSRILSAVPEVATVDVNRHWPNRIVLQITERQIVFQVVIHRGYGWVSSDGVVFHTSSQPAEVVIAAVSINDGPLLRDVASVIEALPEWLSHQVEAISAATKDSITLKLTGKRQVVWGSADETELKLQVIEQLIDLPGQIYDISAPTNPAVR